MKWQWPNVSALCCVFFVGCVPPGYFGPPPEENPGYDEKGPGTASGRVTLHAPTLTVSTDSADGPGTAGTLTSRPTLGVFHPGAPRSTRNTYRQQGSNLLLGEGLWGYDFEFTGLPLGQYLLSQFTASYQDFGASRSEQPYGESVSFTLTDAQPSVDTLVLEFDLGYSADGASLAGRLLIGGNQQPGPLSLVVSGTPETPPAYPLDLLQNGAGYTVPVAPNPNGRYFFRFDNLVDGTWGVYNYAAYKSRIDGSPAVSGIEVRAGYVNPDYAVYAENLWVPQSPNGDLQPLEQGSITCRVNVEGATVWDDDIVAVAERVDGVSQANHRAARYLLPEDMELGGRIDAVLRYLEAGTYRINVYRLAADSADAEQLVEETVVALPVPPQDYIENLAGTRYYFQPEPAATVNLTIEIEESGT